MRLRILFMIDLTKLGLTIGNTCFVNFNLTFVHTNINVKKMEFSYIESKCTKNYLVETAEK